VGLAGEIGIRLVKAENPAAFGVQGAVGDQVVDCAAGQKGKGTPPVTSVVSPSRPDGFFGIDKPSALQFREGSRSVPQS